METSLAQLGATVVAANNPAWAQLMEHGRSCGSCDHALRAYDGPDAVIPHLCPRGKSLAVRGLEKERGS